MNKKFLLSIICIGIIGNVLSQNIILGFYENQTGATERMGEAIEILPNNVFKIYSIQYHQTIPMDSGNWVIKSDTVLILNSKDTIITLTIANENRIRTPISSDSADFLNSIFSAVWWTKTKGYFENGKLESIRHWNSIYVYSDIIYKSGIWTYYYENSQLKRIERYKKGKLRGKPIKLDLSGREIIE